MSKYGVFSGAYFPVLELNTEIYSKYEKYGPEKTCYLDTFHAVVCSDNHGQNIWKKVKRSGKLDKVSKVSFLKERLTLDYIYN